MVKHCDIIDLFSVNFISSTKHTLGHVFAITSSVNNATFSEDICISVGFMLAELMGSQGVIVGTTALSGTYIG